jgi:hypothetical protein
MPIPVTYKGETYNFPDGTPREKVIKYLKEKVEPALKLKQASQEQRELNYGVIRGENKEDRINMYGAFGALEPEPPKPPPKEEHLHKNDTMTQLKRPFLRAGEIAQDQMYQGMETAQKFREHPNPGTATEMALGGLQTTFAGLTGASQGLVKEPIMKYLYEQGAPEQFAEFVSKFAQYGAEIMTPTGIEKLVAQHIGTPLLRESLKMANKLSVASKGSVAQKVFTIKKSDTSTLNERANLYLQKMREIRPQMLKELDEATEGVTGAENVAAKMQTVKRKYEEQVLKEIDSAVNSPVNKAAEVMAQKGSPIKIGPKPHTEEDLITVIKEAKTFMMGKNLDTKKRISDHLIDALHEGDIPVESVRSLVDDGSVDIDFLASRLRERKSESGRFLGSLSYLGRELGFVFGDNPRAKALLDEIAGKNELKITAGRQWAKAVAGMEKIRRGMLVTQMATLNRNIDSQAAMLGIAKADDMMTNFIKGYANVTGMSDVVTPIEDLNLFSAITSRFSKSGKERLGRIFESKQGKLYKTLLGGQLSDQLGAAVKQGDSLLDEALLMGDKSSWFFNIPNRAQEHFFQNISYQAKMAQELKLLGKDIATVDPKTIPVELYEKALQYARKNTFALSAKSEQGQLIQNAFNPKHTGIMGSLLTTIQPFPRFAYANALPFVWEHSPFGFYKLLSKKSREAIANGRPEEVASTLSRAALGTMMYKSAWHVRQSEYAGPKYYQYKWSEDGDKTTYLDMRAYAPYTAYLFLAECALHPEKIQMKDYLMNLVGLNKVAGTGLVFADILAAKKPEDAMSYLKAWGSAYIGSYTVPLRSAKDIISEFQPEEGLRRQVRETGSAGVLGRAQENIPWLSRELPVANTPLSTEVQHSEEPLIRQAFGISVTRSNKIQKEVETINLPWENIFHRTGIPAADNSINKIMAPVVENLVPRVIKLSAYQKGSDAKKRLILGAVFKLIKTDASKTFKTQNPLMAAGIQYEQFSDDERTVLKETLGKNNYLIQRLESLKEMPEVPPK